MYSETVSINNSQKGNKMRKSVMITVLVIGLAVSAQAVQIGPVAVSIPNQGNSTLTSWVNNYLQALDPGKSFNYLGRLEAEGNGSFSMSSLGTPAGEVTVTVNGVGSPTGTWSYLNTNGPELDVVAFVLKAGRETWLYYNTTETVGGDVNVIPFVAGDTYNWATPNGKDLSHFAAFGDPPQSVPEGGSVLGMLVAGLFGLGLYRKNMIS
jgi:hypothetical protein